MDGFKLFVDFFHRIHNKDDTKRSSKTNQPQTAACSSSDKNNLTSLSSQNAQDNGNHLTTSAKHTNGSDASSGELITPSQTGITTTSDPLSNLNGVGKNGVSTTNSQSSLTSDQKQQPPMAPAPQVDTNMTISSLHDKLKCDRPQNNNHPFQIQQTQRQVKFETYCYSEKNNMIHSDKESDSEAQNPTSQQIDEFLKRNPSFLAKHVLENVSTDEIQGWLYQKTTVDDKSGKQKNQNEQFPSSDVVDPTAASSLITGANGSQQLQQANNQQQQKYSSMTTAKVTTGPAVSRRKISDSNFTSSGGASNNPPSWMARKSSLGSIVVNCPGPLTSSGAQIGCGRDSPRGAESGAATPVRKISAHEFNSGELDELPVIDQLSGSFITGGQSFGLRRLA